MSEVKEIRDRLLASDMRQSIENKNLLTTKGAIYAGTGNHTDNGTIYSDGEYILHETDAVIPSDNDLALMVDNTQSTGWKYAKLSNDNFDENSNISARKFQNSDLGFSINNLADNSISINKLYIDYPVCNWQHNISFQITESQTTNTVYLQLKNNNMNPITTAQEIADLLYSFYYIAYNNNIAYGTLICYTGNANLHWLSVSLAKSELYLGVTTPGTYQTINLTDILNIKDSVVNMVIG